MEQSQYESLKIELSKLQDRMKNIETKLNMICDVLDSDIKQNVKKMGEHIDFVDTVYDHVKKPMNYVLSRLGYGQLKDSSRKDERNIKKVDVKLLENT